MSNGSSENLPQPTLRISDLIEKDPLLLSELEVEAIVANLKVGYKEWQAEEAKANATGDRQKLSKGTSVKTTLSDLGL